MHPTRARLAVLFLGLTVAARPMPAQQPPSPARSGVNELALTVAPIAGGIRYLRGLGNRFRLGAALTVGPGYGVVVARGESGRLREWARLYPVLGYRIAGNTDLLVSPLGATLALGDDFSSVYPAGQVALGVRSGRLRVHSVLRTFRIATGNGGGSYRIEWAPIQLGYSFPW